MTVLANQKNLVKRLTSWIEKPISYKLNSIFKKFSNAIYQLLHPLIKKIYQSKLVDNKFARASIFDSAIPNTYLCSNGFFETFIVAAGDKGIARRVFVDREPFDFDKFEKVVQLPGTKHTKSLFIDIGANIGTICIPAIKRNVFSRAIAVEPEPKNFSLLLANIAVNDVTPKITVINTAIGEKDDQELSFELSKTNFGDHRIRNSNSDGSFDEINRDVIKIKSNTLDKTLNSMLLNPNDTLIWIDTQGYEGYVVHGADVTLSLHPPICLEFWPYGLKRSGCFQNLIDSLIKYGYTSFTDLEEDAGTIILDRKSLKYLYEKYGEEGNYTDILCI